MKKGWIIGIILILIVGGYVFMRFSFSPHAPDPCEKFDSIIEQAVQESNPNLCLSIEDQSCSDNCIYVIATGRLLSEEIIEGVREGTIIERKSNESICELIKNNAVKANCYKEIAGIKNNPEICKLIDYTRRKGYSCAMIEKSDYLCVPQLSEGDLCIISFKNVLTCKLISDSKKQDICSLWAGISDCQNLNLEKSKEFCELANSRGIIISGQGWGLDTDLQATCGNNVCDEGEGEFHCLQDCD